MPLSYLERAKAKIIEAPTLGEVEGRFDTHLRNISVESALVLTAHLHLERSVHEIHSRMFGYSRTDRPFRRLGFSASVQILRVSNIVKEVDCNALAILNEIRNGFAHRITTLHDEIKAVDSGRSFRNSCAALGVPRSNTSGERDLFIRWCAKLYLQTIKGTYIASEMRRIMMTDDFIDLFDEIDLSNAHLDPGHQF